MGCHCSPPTSPRGAHGTVSVNEDRKKRKKLPGCENRLPRRAKGQPINRNQGKQREEKKRKERKKSPLRPPCLCIRVHPARAAKSNHRPQQRIIPHPLLSPLLSPFLRIANCSLPPKDSPRTGRSGLNSRKRTDRTTRTKETIFSLHFPYCLSPSLFPSAPPPSLLFSLFPPPLPSLPIILLRPHTSDDNPHLFILSSLPLLFSSLLSFFLPLFICDLPSYICLPSKPSLLDSNSFSQWRTSTRP